VPLREDWPVKEGIGTHPWQDELANGIGCAVQYLGQTYTKNDLCLSGVQV
jgi:hypothetical protein